jgi:hypothetical protein
VAYKLLIMNNAGNAELNATSSQPLEAQVVIFFRQLAESLPKGSASLEIKPNPEPLLGGTRIELIPAVSSAARIVAVAINRGVVYLTFGRATPLEIQVEHRGSPGALIEDIRPFCEAVIGGNFEEDIWLEGSRAFKSIGRLNLGGKVITIRYRGSFHPFDRTNKEHIKYSPFAG